MCRSARRFLSSPLLERLESCSVHLSRLPSFLPPAPGASAACFGLRRRVWTASADRPACPRVAPVPANKTRKRRNVPTWARASASGGVKIAALSLFLTAFGFFFNLQFQAILSASASGRVVKYKLNAKLASQLAWKCSTSAVHISAKSIILISVDASMLIANC